MKANKWQLLETLVQLSNPWMTLIGERWLDAQGEIKTYWRVEKKDSLIVIPVQNELLLLPEPYYRPGVGENTLDFPGGRYDHRLSWAEAARTILQREMQISREHIQTVQLLNPQGWNIDSSFSNQRLFVTEAQIDNAIPWQDLPVLRAEPANIKGAQNILTRLSCLQCRCALLQWMLNQNLY